VPLTAGCATFSDTVEQKAHCATRVDATMIASDSNGASVVLKVFLHHYKPIN
jgi:hypothetical protein